MRKFLAGLLAVSVLVCVALGAVYFYGVHEPASPSTVDRGAVDQSPVAEGPEQLELGRYLALTGNCMGCHTVTGGQPYAGGTPIATPFGTLYGPNITASVEQGIGRWTADDFWRAMHHGKGPEGKLLYPAFPFTEYTNVTRRDADALFVYLRSLPTSDVPSRAHALDFPYNQRALLGLWRALYFTPGGKPFDASEDLAWNRGRYLVEGLAHCAACHTPRTRLGASDSSRALAGGSIMGLDWYAPALTGDTHAGLGRWDAADIAALLRDGVSRQGAATGPMAEVVAQSTQHMSPSDALAIGTYLKSLPAPAAASAPPPPSAAAMQIGKRVYEQQCVQCHQASGEGAPTAWPALAGNTSVTATSPVNIIKVILDGGYAVATPGNPRPHGMPPFSQVLSDNDIAALVTFVRNSWGNAAGEVQPFEVKRAR